MIQSGHNIAHATTAPLSWQVQKCDLIWSIFLQVRIKLFYQIWIMSFQIFSEMGPRMTHRNLTSDSSA